MILKSTYQDGLTIEYHHTGAWVIYSLVDGHLLTRTYYGYTRSEAISEFKAEVAALNAKA